MTLQELLTLAGKGKVDALECISIEGGNYLVRVHHDHRMSTVMTSETRALVLRSTAQLRDLMAGHPQIPCRLVQHNTHDEMGPSGPAIDTMQLAIRIPEARA